jgi:hypothetical protein
MSDCQVCRAATDAFVCAPCGRKLEKAIAEMPALVIELEVTATKQDRISTGGKRGKGDEAPLPFNWSASDQLWAIWNTLSTWARHIAESRSVPCPSKDALMGWMLGAVQSIRMDEAGGLIYDEVTYAHGQAQRLIDRPEPDIYAGRCDAADVRVRAENGQLTPAVSSCGADLYARLDDKAVKCRACGAEYDLADRKRELLDRVDDEWARPHVIANALTSLDEPVTPETLRKWIERGHIKQTGIDDDGKALYRVGDVRVRIALMRVRRAERLAS